MANISFITLASYSLQSISPGIVATEFHQRMHNSKEKGKAICSHLKVSYYKYPYKICLLIDVVKGKEHC